MPAIPPSSKDNRSTPRVLEGGEVCAEHRAGGAGFIHDHRDGRVRPGIAIVPAALRCIAMEQVRFVALQDASARSALHLACREDGVSEATKAFRRGLIAMAEHD